MMSRVGPDWRISPNVIFLLAWHAPNSAKNRIQLKSEYRSLGRVPEGLNVLIELP
jgi:hypothetical protein